MCVCVCVCVCVYMYIYIYVYPRVNPFVCSVFAVIPSVVLVFFSMRVQDMWARTLAPRVNLDVCIYIYIYIHGLTMSFVPFSQSFRAWCWSSFRCACRTCGLGRWHLGLT